LNKHNSILYFIQLPPPVHGVSIINQQVFNSEKINNNFHRQLLEIKFSDRIDQLRSFSINKAFRFIVTIVQLITVLIKEPPHLIYFSLMPVGKGFYRDVFFALIMKMFRREIVFHLHNRGIEKQSSRICQRFLYHNVFNNSHIIHLSQYLIDREFMHLKLSNTHYHVIPNGVFFDTSNSKIKSNNNNEVQLLFLSNLFPEKGLFELLDSFKTLREKHSNIYLSIIGTPYKNSEKRLEKYFIENDKLKNSIYYHGSLYGEAKKEFLENSDIFIFPSWFREECFPLVILEAMAAGLPIVATDVGVINEIIDDGIDGFIVPCENQDLLTDKIDKLIKSKQLRLSMGRKAREKYKKKYTLAIFEQNMFQVLNKIANLDSV